MLILKLADNSRVVVFLFFNWKKGMTFCAEQSPCKALFQKKKKKKKMYLSSIIGTFGEMHAYPNILTVVYQ